ncbi:MAG: TrkA family potassium uptake protein [Deltaproteobacteria bacterium]|jgi:trk system potassium uptake protein TrkA|nr:TrkA family potassium uptake protein [Deltaproteobacteria bacterium]
MKPLEIGVIGLGKFGLHFGRTLMKLGHRVVGLDREEAVTRAAQDELSRVYLGDATDRLVLEQLRFQDMDCVALSVGHSMEASILTALNLHDLAVPRIIAKAMSREHREVLLRLGVHQVVQPETDAAYRMALRINNPGMLDFLEVGGGILLQRVTVSAWAGKTLAELNLTNTHKVMAVAKKQAPDQDFAFVPDPRTPLEKGEALMLIGSPDAILSLKP